MNKKLALFIAGASVLLISAVFASVAFAQRDPLIGIWRSTDTDGSNQTLTIGGGPGDTYHVRYFDDGATVCGLDPVSGDFLYAASARGVLSGSGGTIAGTLPVYCLAAPPFFKQDAAFQYTYQSATDTLLDSHGVVWYR